jgi:hypothetical protein
MDVTGVSVALRRAVRTTYSCDDRGVSSFFEKVDKGFP